MQIYVKLLKKIYDEKPISGRKININYEGKFTLKLLMKIKVEKPNVNKNIFGLKKPILDTKSSKILNVQKWCQNGSTAII